MLRVKQMVPFISLLLPYFVRYLASALASQIICKCCFVSASNNIAHNSLSLNAHSMQVE